MNFDNPLLFNTCYYIRLKNVSEEIFEQFKLISVKVLDMERNDDKLLVVENQFFKGGGYEFMFLFFEENKSMLYIAELERIGAIDFYHNVTDDLITGCLDENKDFRIAYFGFPDEQKEKNALNDCAYLFDTFILKHRTIDHVMDRINALGINNIWEIDREILKQSIG